MNTKLFIRPNTDIRILDTEYTELALVGLRVDNINNYEVQVGDILSIRFDNPTLTPDYVGDWEVVAISPTYSCCLTDPINTIVVALPWGESTGLNPGWARNIVRAADGGLLSSAGYGFQGSGFNGTSPYMQSIGELSDGTLIIGGAFTTYNGVSANRIVGINPDGTINATFSYGTGFSGGGQAVVNVEVDSQDRVYVGGGFTTYNGTTVSCLVRLTATGSVDPTFNVGTGLLGGTPFAYSIELDEANGRIYIGGQFTTYNGTSANRIVCLLEDGSIDTSFNYGTGFSAAFGTRRLRLGPDDKLYCVGGFTSYNGTSINRICRLNTDGTLDTSFVVGTGFNAEAFDIMFYGGKIYVIGTFTSYDGVSANRIIRLNNDGSRDTLFDIGTGLDNTAYGIINHQGFLYAYGLFTSYNGQAANKIAVIDYFGNLNINYQGQFNSGSFVFVIYPLDNSLLIGGSFTSYNGQTINRISIFKSLLRSIRYEVKELNLKEDLQFPLTYNIIDIKEPQNRKSDYSKSITLPGTKNNNRILAQLFEIGADSTYNTNLKKDVFVTQDGLEIFNGYIKIENINRENWNDISYDVKIFGKVADLFSRLKTQSGADLKLSNLDFSEWNHNLSRTAIANSWIGNIKRNDLDYQNVTIGPSYSVSDTGFNSGRTEFLTGTHSLQVGDIVRFEMDFPNDPSVNFNQSEGFHTVTSVSSNSVTCNLPFQSGGTNSGILTKYLQKGNGYVYPTINLFGNDWGFNKNDIKLSVYAKEVLLKIFKYVNLSVTSDFIDTEYFNRLIVVGNNIQKSTDSRNFYAKTDGIITLVGNQDIPGIGDGYYILPMSVVADVNSNWTATYSYQNNTLVNQEQTFNFYFNAQVNPFIPQTGGFDIILYRSLDTLGNPDSSWSSGQGNPYDDSGNLMVFNIFTSGGFDIAPTQTNIYSSVDATYNGTSNIVEVYITTPTITLRPGEEVRFALQYDTNDSTANILYVSNSYIASYDIKVSSMMPDMTARDFLTSIIGMHNLYLENVRGNDTEYIMEPFSEYYTLLDSQDWTDKVDLQKDIIIKPVSPDMYKNMKWTYSDDSDFYNKDYSDNYRNIYGTSEYTQTSEFNNNSKETKIQFAATPMVDQSNYGVVLPKIVRDATNQPVDKFKPRILYWTGLRYSNNPQGVYLDTTSEYNGFPTQYNYFPLPMYGYAGHFDNPIDATIDINFGYNSRYYYGGNYPFYITENTLYNKYYKEYVDEVSDNNTKYLICYLKLNSYDISNLKFRRLYYINNNLYRLQSIDDYDPLTGDTTKVTFIKVKQSPQSELLNGIGFNNPGVINIETNNTDTRDPILNDDIEITDLGVIIPKLDNYIEGDLSLSLDTNFTPTNLGGSFVILNDMIHLNDGTSVVALNRYTGSLVFTYSIPLGEQAIYIEKSTIDSSLLICSNLPGGSTHSISKYNIDGNLDTNFVCNFTSTSSPAILVIEISDGYYIRTAPISVYNGVSIGPTEIIKVDINGVLDSGFTYGTTASTYFYFNRLNESDNLLIQSTATQSFGTYSIGPFDVLSLDNTGSYNPTFQYVEYSSNNNNNAYLLASNVNNKSLLCGGSTSSTWNGQYRIFPVSVNNTGSITQYSNNQNSALFMIGFLDGYIGSGFDSPVYYNNNLTYNGDITDILSILPSYFPFQGIQCIGSSIYVIDQFPRILYKYDLIQPSSNSLFGDKTSFISSSYQSQILNSSNSSISLSNNTGMMNSSNLNVNKGNNNLFLNVDNLDIEPEPGFTYLSKTRVINTGSISMNYSVGTTLYIDGGYNFGRITLITTSSIPALTTIFSTNSIRGTWVLFPASDDAASVTIYQEESVSHLAIKTLSGLNAATTYKWNYINIG
mgnify:FL=1